MNPPDPPGLVIRPAIESDLTALEWDGEYMRFRRVYANLFRDTLSDRILMWVVTTPQGKMVGQVFVMLKSRDHHSASGKNSAYVFSLRIKPQWRNMGIGKRLMHHMEEDLQQRGFTHGTLNVAKENLNALRFYQRLGYTIIGSRAGIWSYKDHEGQVLHVNEPAWRMIKELCPH